VLFLPYDFARFLILRKPEKLASRELAILVAVPFNQEAQQSGVVSAGLNRAASDAFTETF
jgi:hypothetical protein